MPGKSRRWRRNRKPSRCAILLTVISGDVSRDRTRLIRADLRSIDNRSTIQLFCRLTHYRNIKFGANTRQQCGGQYGANAVPDHSKAVPHRGMESKSVREALKTGRLPNGDHPMLRWMDWPNGLVGPAVGPSARSQCRALPLPRKPDMLSDFVFAALLYRREPFGNLWTVRCFLVTGYNLRPTPQALCVSGALTVSTRPPKIIAARIGTNLSKVGEVGYRVSHRGRLRCANEHCRIHRRHAIGVESVNKKPWTYCCRSKIRGA